jgi:hypothetical protein
MERVRCIFDLDGFTGSRTIGSRRGSCPPHVDVGILAGCEYRIENADDDDDLKEGGGGDIDEADTDQLDGLINFVSSL